MLTARMHERHARGGWRGQSISCALLAGIHRHELRWMMLCSAPDAGGAGERRRRGTAAAREQREEKAEEVGVGMRSRGGPAAAGGRAERAGGRVLRPGMGPRRELEAAIVGGRSTTLDSPNITGLAGWLAGCTHIHAHTGLLHLHPCLPWPAPTSMLHPHPRPTLAPGPGWCSTLPCGGSWPLTAAPGHPLTHRNT